MTRNELLDKKLKQFAIVNCIAQIIFLAVVSIPMFLTQKNIFVYAFIWVILSSMFFWWTMKPNNVKQIINIFTK
jgi:hypothetical protein